MSTIVVGAGLSGLCAARRLADAGEDVVVLEATDHVGGRTWTNRDRLLHGQPADLGGSMIDRGQDAILRLCDEYGLALTPHFSLFPSTDADGRYSGASVLRNHLVLDDEPLSADERERIATEIRAAFDAVPPSPVETLVGWAHRAGLTPRAARAFSAQSGLNPTGVPYGIHVSHVEPPEIGQMCWMLQDGSDIVSQSVADGLNIRFEHPVRLIVRDGGRITVETDRETFSARDVVVTTPVRPTLRIGFDPVLPAWKINALLSTPMTQAGKIVGQYSDGATLAAQMGTGIVSDGPVGFLWHRGVGPEDTLVVLGLVTADDGRGALWDEEHALEAMDRLIAHVAGDGPQRLAGILHDWTSAEFAGGVVSLVSGDPVGLPAALGHQVGTNLHFAGEHTAPLWTTSMDGAIRSGRRAGDEVLRRRRTRRVASTTESA